MIGLALCACAVLLVAALQSGRIHAREARIPAELHGHWVTDSPKYAGRYMDVFADKVVLGVGGIRISVQPVVRVEALAKPREPGTHYGLDTITHAGDRDRIELAYLAKAGPALRIHRVDAIWTRAPEDPEVEER